MWFENILINYHTQIIDNRLLLFSLLQINEKHYDQNLFSDDHHYSYEAQNVLQNHLQHATNRLAAEIPRTSNAILESISKSNRRNINVGSSIALGAFLIQLSLNVGDNDVTIGDIVNRIGRSISTAGFAGDRLVEYREPVLNCGINEFNQVLIDYDVLFHLNEVYYHENNLLIELRPKELKYHVNQFGIDLCNALSCLLDEGASSKRLILAINAVTDSLHRQLQYYENNYH